MSLRSVARGAVIRAFARRWYSNEEALAILQPLSRTYIPWSPTSVLPGDLIRILNNILVFERGLVVECGSGISTFYIARLLQETGGHIISVEHDEVWTMFVQRKIADEGLAHVCTIVHSPLVPEVNALNDNLWYDKNLLREAIGGRSIDLLLVDGPPASKKRQRLSRYPAVPCLKDYFAPSIMIALDDAKRRGEREVLRRWEEGFDLTFQSPPPGSRLAVSKQVPLSV